MAEIAVFQDVQSSGVAGTIISTTIIADQPLNTEKFNNIAGCSLSANKVTLPIGDYIINLVDRVTMGTNVSAANLFITDAANNILDTGIAAEVNLNQDSREIAIAFAVSLSVETEIKYRAVGNATNGVFRYALSEGDEHYQKLIIQKVG